MSMRPVTTDHIFTLAILGALYPGSPPIPSDFFTLELLKNQDHGNNMASRPRTSVARLTAYDQESCN